MTSGPTRKRQINGLWVFLLCSGLLCLFGSALGQAATPACEDSLIRFFTQIYLNGAYCTCPGQHRETITEAGRIRHVGRYTLPGLSLGLGRGLPDLSNIDARFWGTIVSGPGGQYALSVRVHEEGREDQPIVKHHRHLKEGQEVEFTDGAKQRLRTGVPYHVMLEGRNPALQPQQQLAVQGRACFYLVSGS